MDRKVVIALCILILTIMCFITIVLIGLTIQRNIDDVRTEISDFNITEATTAYGFSSDDPWLIHEDGTPYNCTEARAVLKEILAFCDDFENSNDTWTSTQIYLQKGEQL